MTTINAAREPNSNPYDILVSILTQANLGLLSNLKIIKFDYELSTLIKDDEQSNDTVNYLLSFKQFPLKEVLKRNNPNPQDLDWT